MTTNPIFRFFSSMQLTVVLLALSLVLVFFGTLDQVQYGINLTQKIYFQGIVAIWKYPEAWYFGKYLSWLGLPIPGGYLIGPLLVINLLCAHFRSFRPTWKNIGLMPVHGGILLLLIGQGVTDIMQKEVFMWLDEGSTSNFAQSFVEDELVIVDKSDPETDKVVSIPAELLKDQKTFQHPALPFKVDILAFYPNATIHQTKDQLPLNVPKANKGLGLSMNLLAQPVPLTVEDDTRNLSTALVEIKTTDGSLGTWLVCSVFEDQFVNQAFEVDGKPFEISMRLKLHYFPFSVHLEEFTHDKYPGSNIPKNFASQVEVTDFQTGEVRESLIYMNHPLRYAGFTFFQASFAKQDTASMFQIVSNPGWLIPYLAWALVTIGLSYQFGVALVFFLKRRFKS
jgi:hypothetical protein